MHETGFVLVTSVLSLAVLAFLWPAYRNRDKPGAVGFIILVLGAVCYSLATVGAVEATTELGWFISQNFVVLGASTATIGWVLFALEYTGMTSLSRRVLAPLVAVPVAGQGLVWTNEYHTLMYPSMAELEAGLQPQFEPLYVLFSMFGYGLILAATGLIMYDTAGTSGIRRRQGIALGAAAIPPLLGNLPFTQGFITLDLTPLGFVISSVMIGWALFYANFLAVAPVGRQRVYEQMDDPAATVDQHGRIVDCNAAARELFEVGTDWQGMWATEFFAPLPDEIQAAIAAGELVSEAEICIDVEGSERYFVVTCQPMGDADRAILGEFVLLRDITPQKQRELELDLMRQVQSRVLRHNLKNKLTVVTGHTESLASDSENVEQRAQQVMEASHDLLSTTEKARAVERLVEESRDREPVDLTAILDTAVAETRRAFPDVTIETRYDADLVVETVPAIDIAIENLIENAAEHNEGYEQVVDVGVEQADNGAVLISIADTGPGVPEHELSVIEQGEESQLDHGSGLGLWLVNWVIDRADATIAYQTTDEGTTVTIRIPDR